ncbi:hypothetical protein [Metabacillus idriensis]|uniref:hypothetical protein n=1 Tax=Metabacillus idriensis TaxID=324768 RepID=UPI00174A5557|nr:hypothetical protein [Metabacillus idriensis]
MITSSIKPSTYIAIWAMLIPFFILTGFYPIVTLALIVAALGFGLTCYFFIESNHRMIYFLFVVSIVQNLVVIYLMGKFNISQAYELQYYKELFLLGMLGYLLVFKNKLLKNMTSIDLVSILFIFYVLLVSIWLGDANTFTKVASLRQVLIPFLFYFLGKHIILTGTNLEILWKRIVKFGVVIVLFGLFESFVIPTFWMDVEIYNFFFEKRGPEFLTMVNGLPSNFYTSDFVSIVGEPVRRMASFVANPPVLAHILGYLAVFTLFTRKHLKRSSLVLFILSAGVFLTLGKGGIITLAVGVIFYILFMMKKPFLTYLVCCFGFFGAVLYIKKVIDEGLSAVDHIFGFTNSLMLGLQHPLGSGLGTVGNLSEVYNSNVTVSEGGGAESFLGLVVGQFGIIGFTLFSLFFILTFFRLIKLMKSNSNNEFYYSILASLAAVIFAIFLTAFLTESAISFTSAGIPVLLSSILINNGKKLSEFQSNFKREKKKRKRIRITW